MAGFVPDFQQKFRQRAGLGDVGEIRRLEFIPQLGHFAIRDPGAEDGPSHADRIGVFRGEERPIGKRGSGVDDEIHVALGHHVGGLAGAGQALGREIQPREIGGTILECVELAEQCEAQFRPGGGGPGEFRDDAFRVTAFGQRSDMGDFERAGGAGGDKSGRSEAGDPNVIGDMEFLGVAISAQFLVIE